MTVLVLTLSQGREGPDTVFLHEGIDLAAVPPGRYELKRLSCHRTALPGLPIRLAVVGFTRWGDLRRDVYDLKVWREYAC